MSAKSLLPDVEASFKVSNFVKRVEVLARQHTHPFNSVQSVYNKEKAHQVLRQVCQDPKYVTSEKLFADQSKHGPYTFRLLLDLRDGMVDTCYFLKEGEKFLTPGPQTAIMMDLNEDVYVCSMYKDYDELKVIVTEIKSIWDDFRDEFLRRKGIIR